MMLFNWFDFVILILLGTAAYAGVKVGLFTQLFVIIGFFGGLFLGGWLFPHILPVHDRTLLTIINANLVLILATFCAVKGYDYGRKFHVYLGKGHLHTLESVLGVIVSSLAVLAFVWLISPTIGRLPFTGLSNSANDALITLSLSRNLPPIPAVMAEFNRQIDPNASPKIDSSAPQTIALSNGVDFSNAAQITAKATVRVTSFGCGGTISGSGFVVAPHVVATNAHVIAGVKRPIVKIGGRSYEGTPILFNPSLDYALLRVDKLDATPLQYADVDVSMNTAVAVIGFPGNDYSVQAGVIRNDLHIFQPNIYDVGNFGRDVYEIQTVVNAGSSGGPVVTPNGQVVGMIFAKSAEVDGYAYALTSPSLKTLLAKSGSSTKRVSTGVCMSG